MFSQSIVKDAYQIIRTSIEAVLPDVFSQIKAFGCCRDLFPIYKDFIDKHYEEVDNEQDKSWSIPGNICRGCRR